MNIIHARNIIFDYFLRDESDEVVETLRALDDFSVDIEEGSFVCLLGHNGSGKSTFAKLINALNLPDEGTMIVSGMDTRDRNLVLQIRAAAGMVFQNPDNQIISNVVEEDVAFGPENVGIPEREILIRVDEALDAVGMSAMRYKSPNQLSGGQKQRTAIAGIMAMRPKCIIFDEPTAMLDPDGRKEVLKLAHTLNKEEGITIVHITHYMEETIDADRIIVMESGKVALDSEGRPMDGTPREIFSKAEDLGKLSLSVPQVTELAYELSLLGVPVRRDILSRGEFVEAILKLTEEGRC